MRVAISLPMRTRLYRVSSAQFLYSILLKTIQKKVLFLYTRTYFWLHRRMCVYVILCGYNILCVYTFCYSFFLHLLLLVSFSSFLLLFFRWTLMWFTFSQISFSFQYATIRFLFLKKNRKSARRLNRVAWIVFYFVAGPDHRCFVASNFMFALASTAWRKPETILVILFNFTIAINDRQPFFVLFSEISSQHTYVRPYFFLFYLLTIAKSSYLTLFKSKRIVFLAENQFDVVFCV